MMTIMSMKILGGPGDDEAGEKDYSTGIVKSPLTLSGPSTSRSRMCGKEAKYKYKIHNTNTKCITKIQNTK